MLLEVNFIIALIGSGLAGAWDLKTTEIPDEITALMATIGISSYFFLAFSTGSFSLLLDSLTVGTVFGIFGIVMYKARQWGGGDSALLAAIGFMVPRFYVNNFALNYFVNIFMVSLVYIIGYTIVLGAVNKKIRKKFLESVKIYELAGSTALVVLGLAVFLAGMAFYLAFIFLALMMLFVRYAMVLEKNYFTRKTPSSQLRPGDVLENNTIKGLTKEEITVIQKKHKYVTIKDGIRLGPVFFIALAVTAVGGGLFV